MNTIIIITIIIIRSEKKVITTLKNRSLLGNELEKIYTDNHTILTFLSVHQDSQFAPSDNQKNNRLNFLENILSDLNVHIVENALSEKRVERLLIHEYEGKNAFQWSLYFCSLNTVQLLLSSSERCDWFMKSMGYDDQLTEDEVAEKYVESIKKSKRGILYTAAHCGLYEPLDWAIETLKKYKLKKIQFF